MNHVDPMGTRILVANDAMEDFVKWGHQHLSPFILGLFNWAFPQGWEGAHSEFAWNLGLGNIVSNFSELEYNGKNFDTSKLTMMDLGFLEAIRSDKVYIFDKNGLRRKTDDDNATSYASAELGLRAAAGFVARPFANALAYLGDVADKYHDEILGIDQALHGGSPGAGGAGDVLLSADEAMMALRSLRVGDKVASLASVLGDLRTVSLAPRQGMVIFSDITGGAATNAIDLLKRTRIRGLTPSEYLKWALKTKPDALRIAMPWAEGNYGIRILDHFNQLTQTGYEGTLLKWSRLTGDELQFEHKLRQAAMDRLILKEGLGDVKKMIWFGTEPIPLSGPVSILGEDLSKAGIEYKLILPPPPPVH